MQLKVGAAVLIKYDPHGLMAFDETLGRIKYGPRPGFAGGINAFGTARVKAPVALRRGGVAFGIL